MKDSASTADRIIVPGIPDSTPIITAVYYDCSRLRATVEFERWDGCVYIEFSGVEGFRVLDEGDLSNFYAEDNFWFRRIRTNGWLDEQRCLRGYLTARTSEDLHEFVVLGQDDYLNVFCSEEPRVSVESP